MYHALSGNESSSRHIPVSLRVTTLLMQSLRSVGRLNVRRISFTMVPAPRLSCTSSQALKHGAYAPGTRSRMS